MHLAVDDDDVVAGLDGGALRAALLQVQPGGSGRGREGEGRGSPLPLLLEQVGSVGEERLKVGVGLLLRLLHHKLQRGELSVDVVKR